MSDEIRALQRQWHEARALLEAVGFPLHGPERANFNLVDTKLASLLWETAKADIEADRARHPKARRNQKPDPSLPLGAGRFLP